MPVAPGGFSPFGIQALEELAPRLASRAGAFTLHVGDGYSERIIYACGSGLYVFSVGERSGTGITGALVKAGKLAEADLEEVQARCREAGTPLRDFLVARGSIRAEEYDEISRRVVLDEVLDLVFWEDALHSTYEAPPPTEFFASDAHVQFADLAPGAIEDGIASWTRKWLAWKPILRGDDTPFRVEPPGNLRAAGSADALAALLRACRKSGTIRSLRRDTDLRLIEICEHARSAIDAGFLSISAEAPAPPGARQSIEKLEKALPLVLGKDLIRLKLASLYRRAGEPDRACAHFQTVADQAASRGDRALAMDCLRSILAIRPESTAALRSLVEIQSSRGLAKEAVQAVLQVEAVLFREKKGEAMRAVAEILGELGDTLAVREVNADLKVVGGRPEEALEEYRALADRYEAARDFERAVQALGKALRIDADDEELKTRLVRIKQRGRRPGEGTGAGAGRRATSPASARRLPLRSGALVILAGTAVLAVALLGTGGRLEVEADGELVEEVRPPPDPGPDPAGVAGKPAGVAPGPGPGSGSEAPVERTPPPTAPVAKPAARPVSKPRSPPPETADASPSTPEHRPPLKDPPAIPVTRRAPPKPLPAPAPAPAEPPTEPAIAVPVEPRRPTPRGEDAAPRIPPVARTVEAPRAEAAPEAKSLSPGDLLAELLPPGPCPAHGLHRTTIRALPRGRRILVADGCFLRIEDATTRELLLECEGEEGTRWAYDASGEVICRWSPGKPLRGVPVDPEVEWLPEGWELPEDATAVAVGISEVAVLGRTGTRVIRFPGLESIFSTRLPPWRAGFFTEAGLVVELDGAKSAAGAAVEKWLVVDPGTLDPRPAREKPPAAAPQGDAGPASPEARLEDRGGSRGTEESPEG